MDDRSLPRRGLLIRSIGALGIAVGLSGCVEEIGEQFPPGREWPTGEYAPDLPVTKRSTVVESGVEAFEGRDIEDEEAFERALEEHGIDVESVEREQGTLTVEYVATDRDGQGTLHEVGPIAGAYAALIGTDYEAEFLEITILDDDSSSVGAAEVETSWAIEYNRDAYTAKEYGELVAGTIESRRYPTEVGATPEG
ncbi:hypothetical protein [Halalkalicoccus sp. NIPERK01]|uniref:hypothetical protein n=1 Tax=Halalkalicoccus sp. NIPERK01 TaxID=3053469 RepID=UPI00256EC820|nr:hypothetical protein [Halalkalicoccus sp. NIPERK01]MDL5361386.1 hypothetical protein [Halalkalicoccus sp. NIPERK01]